MFHREVVVDYYTVRISGDVPKLEAFASICLVPPHHFMVSGFVMNFQGATPLGCKEREKVPRPASGTVRVVRRPTDPLPDTRPFNHPRAILVHSTSGMSMLFQQHSCKPWNASNQRHVGLWWHLGNINTCIFLQ